ncbi:peptidoglycan recognition family protein [Streptomyces sp. CC228A]|uniref:peptidoglycan recognition protein family protein n=1 Tax=Streptomyces sp. CC228A TaxID=2898186 RepID=UPI001F1DC496|nr:peptidoglycan recognition family protein [Streptomyces sp. CC228A]
MDFVSRSDLGLPPTSPAAYLASTRGVKVHYLGTAYTSRAHDGCAAYVRQVRSAHLANTAENYVDVAYNLLVCEHGAVFEGRGAHRRCGANGSAELNRAHYAVCALLGSSGLTEPPDAMLRGLRDAIDYLRREGDAGDEVLGHRDGHPTSCPGEPLHAWVRAGAPRPADPTPAPAPPPDPDPVEEDLMPVPAVLLESLPGGPELPGGEWLELPAAKDTVILRGPCVYAVTATVALTGVPAGARPRLMFSHVDIATRRRYRRLAVDLPQRAGEVTGQVSASGRLPRGQYLKVQALAELGGVSVSHRTIEGLYWPEG